MTSRKRSAKATPTPESSDEPPHKRARSQRTSDASGKQNGDIHSSEEVVKDNTEHAVAEPSSTKGARGPKNDAAPLADLPQTWDQASAADKMLMTTKATTKLAWSQIERSWERLTNEKPAEDMLKDRYKQLKDIIPRSEILRRGKAGAENVEEHSEIPHDHSTLQATEVRPLSPATSGILDTSPPDTLEITNPVAEPLETPSATPAKEDPPEEDLPSSWEQASPEDQVLARMKMGRKAWVKIEDAWEELTGVRPAEGVLRDRYIRIKDLVIPPKLNAANKRLDSLKAGSSDKTSDRATAQRVKPMVKTSSKRKADDETEDNSPDEVSDASSHDYSDELSKASTKMTGPKSRGAMDENSIVFAFDGPNTKRTKTMAREPENGSVGEGLSEDSDELSKPSRAKARSTKGPHKQAAVAAESGTHSVTETADEMLVEMKERGCSWDEIVQAWTERTGITYAPSTLRRRYPLIKNGTVRAVKKVPSLDSTSSRQKGKAASPNEGSYESSTRRNKSIAEISRVTETPTKRNMDRGKRKSTVKYTESTTDEDEFYAAPVEPATTAPTSAKRRPARAAKVDRSDPEWLVTNEKSPLVDEDLHAEFSDPKTYENFSKSDWEDLRETLPPNVPVNPDGYSIPMTFFKYDPDFRRGIREFQEDLGAGRLDPKWQAEAAEAMEARARGDFDAYKEEQFEAFWGQKQKMDHHALAGESTKIKLDLLIQNDIFKVGDYFSYSRVVGPKDNRVLVEKDCKIVKLDGKILTFAIPPGQRKYSRHMFSSGISRDTTVEPKVAAKEDEEEPLTNMNDKPGTAPVIENTQANGDEASEASGKRNEALKSEKLPENGNLTDSNEVQDAESGLNDTTNKKHPAEASSSNHIKAEANKTPKQGTPETTTAEKKRQPNGASPQAPALLPQEEEPNNDNEDITRSLSSLNQLEQSIVDIDGRIPAKELPVQNVWKNLRCMRNNQDLGSLFEMREEFYVYKHPQIVKEPSKRRR